MDTFAGREVIARNQLVEIGGGFRIPDVLRDAAARICAKSARPTRSTLRITNGRCPRRRRCCCASILPITQSKALRAMWMSQTSHA